MAGFLDKYADSIEAEYAASIDGDMLGKFVLKNFLLHCLRLSEQDFEVPVGRNGDIELGSGFPGDALIHNQRHPRVIEIKLSRAFIRHTHRDTVNVAWLFSKLLRTDKKLPRRYDILVAIGIMTPSLGSYRYLSHIDSVAKEFGLPHRRSRRWVLPHEPEFLSKCGFLIMPRRDVDKNHIDLTVRAVKTSRYSDFFAWGIDRQGCRRLWDNAFKMV